MEQIGAMVKGGLNRLLGLVSFIQLIFRRFAEDQGMPNAASLTFNTLLSLVPLMTVTMAILSAFPISEQIVSQIEELLYNNFVPAAGDTVREYLGNFSEKASRLSGAGFLFLIIVALMMMSNIEKALNTIWRTESRRRATTRFLVYWAILSMGPILIGASVAVTSYLVSLPLFTENEETLSLFRQLLVVAPVLASAIAFSLLYLLVPHRSVPIRHAMIGGIAAGIMFELAKRGFVLYLTKFPTYEAIYGAMAALPIFLVWVYLSWAVTLLGAEITHCLGLYRYQQGNGDIDSRGDLHRVYCLLFALREAQSRGESLSVRQLSKQLGYLPDEYLESLLLQLKQQKMILQTNRGKWALARDLSEVSFFELYRMGNFVLPDLTDLSLSDSISDQAFKEVLLVSGESLEAEMEYSLESMFVRASSESVDRSVQS